MSATITRTNVTFPGAAARRAAGVGPQYRVWVREQDGYEALAMTSMTESAAEIHAARYAKREEVAAVTIQIAA